MTECLCCLCSRYYALGDYVIRVACKSALFGTPMEQPLGSPSAFALQLGPEFSVPVADTLYVSTRVDVACAIHGNIYSL